jgi:hypothetical protein
MAVILGSAVAKLGALARRVDARKYGNAEDAVAGFGGKAEYDKGKELETGDKLVAKAEYDKVCGSEIADRVWELNGDAEYDKRLCRGVFMLAIMVAEGKEYDKGVAVWLEEDMIVVAVEEARTLNKQR